MFDAYTFLLSWVQQSCTSHQLYIIARFHVGPGNDQWASYCTCFSS